MTADDSSTPDCSADVGNCVDAVEELFTYLDGQLTEERRATIQAHLDDCAPCLEAYDFHAELKQVVSEKCRTELPEGLRDRVFGALRALES